ncbi:unnamed protein product [Echinostoma caproni]|uniref:MATH domain-containing protein n=1 Tax=Echinostoma caproni TaxID=27848 RepID=A0A183A5K2_9TREM|nr:unnamed protein product [Echinostoma caproni]
MKFQTSGGNKSPVLQLHRVVRVGDKLDTHVFTFILPPQLTRGFLQSAQSKEFVYGGQKWQIRLEYYSDPLDLQSRRGSYVVHYQKQPLGVVLQSCSVTNGIKIGLDYARFTILHQEHFNRNLVREEIGSQFIQVQPFVKVPRWIESGFLSKEHYLFDDWSAIMEVELRGAVTVYEEQLRVPRDSKEAMRCRSLESTSFPFAYADWSLSIEWRGSGEHSNNSERDIRPTLSMQRHGRTKHWTRVRFRAIITWHDLGTVKTGVMDQLLAPESGACTNPVPFGDRRWFSSSGGPVLNPKSRIVIRIEFHMAVPISRVDLIPTEPQGGKNCSRVSDPLGFDWIVMSDILGSLVKLRVFPDPENLVTPRKEDSESVVSTRLASFNIQLIPYDNSMNIVRSAKPFYTCTVPLIGKSTTDNRLECGDICSDIALQLDVEKVCSSEFGYSRPADNAITLRIEWLNLAVINRTEHSAFDDLESLQRYQMLTGVVLLDAFDKYFIARRSQELQSKTSELKRVLGSVKSDSTNDGRLSFQHSVETSPVYSGRVLPAGEDESCVKREVSKQVVRQVTENRQNNFEAGQSRQPGQLVHRRSHQGELLTDRNHISSFHTPPIFVDESPERNGSHTRSLTPAAAPASWRRHSSCLEDVGSCQQRARRRLPSPPNTAVPMTADGHLSVNFCGSPNYASSPRLTARSSFERHEN